MTIEHEISDAIAGFQTLDLSPDVSRKARLAMLDWLACALAGNRTATGAAMQRFAETERTDGESLLLLPGLPNGSARQAALLNGTLSHALELDDIYAPALYHPGVCVISAALAATQHAGANGQTFLRAVTAGYEISNRIGAAVNPEHYRFWHTTGTVGTLGAAAAACVALGLEREECNWAIGNAATMAAGLKEAFRSDGMTKPLHAGRAAEGGVLATMLASAGVTGAGDMLSGASGFAAAMGAGRSLDGCLDTIFDDFTITRPTLKRFAACGHTFAPVDAVLEIVAAVTDLKPEQISQITVHTYSAAIESAGNLAPKTVFEARFSIAFCVAAALCDHDLSGLDALAAALEDARVHSLCSKVIVVADPKFDCAFPSMRGAAVAVTTNDGRVHKMHIETRKGAPENPLDEAEIRRKASSLMTQSPFRESAQHWIDWCDGLQNLPDLRHPFLPGYALHEAAR